MKLISSSVSDGLQVTHQRKERPSRKEIMEDSSLRKEKKEYFKDLITGHIKLNFSFVILFNKNYFPASTVTKGVALDPFLLGDNLYVTLSTTRLTSKVNYANELIMSVRNTGQFTNVMVQDPS